MGVQLHSLAGGGVLVDVHLNVPAGIQHSIWHTHGLGDVLSIHIYFHYLYLSIALVNSLCLFSIFYDYIF